MPYNIENIYTYHAPTQDKTIVYTELRGRAKYLAEFLLQSCPDSRERSLALTKLEEVVMWANASIAREESPTP